VNVILTDIRALDTWGEVLVIAVVAAGVVALSIARRRDPQDADGPPDGPRQDDGARRGDAEDVAPGDDSAVAEVPT
jgi:multicomponent Na+:H+ antiporter subunit A